MKTLSRQIYLLLILMTNLLALLFIGNIGLIELVILVLLVVLACMLPVRLYKRKKDKPIVKNIYGIIFLIVGLTLMGLGTAVLSNNSSSNQTIKTIGLALIGLGLIFFISGIILVTTKPSNGPKG